MRTAPFRLALIALLCAGCLAVPAIVVTHEAPAGAVTATTCAGPRIAKPGGGYWTCAFDEEFSGTALDQTKWMALTTAHTGTTGGAACFVNTRNNITVANGHLSLTARREAAPLLCQGPGTSLRTQYTSGQVSTSGRFSQTYGRFAVRAKFPAATVAGLQSSIWMWPQNPPANVSWPESGEIDIAEEYSRYADRVIPYVHYLHRLTYSLFQPGGSTVNNVTNRYCLIKDVNAYHEYALVWTPTRLTITFDGATCLVDDYRAMSSVPGGPFNRPFYLTLTQALGIGHNPFNPATTPMPATTQVDWVRIWK
ncbi:MAG TPA: glycoside hydrolase family 16 protein [Jatrophihabitans sp.]|jgi:beta-glucanase (GH16 family)|nr:glycoside hydrolase family 16 protein [Jatrophihabitans sp.]